MSVGRKSLMKRKIKRERVSQIGEVDQVPYGWSDTPTQIVGI